MNELNSSPVRCNEIAIRNVIKRPSSIEKALVIQMGMGMVNTQFRVIGVGSVDRFIRRFLYEAMSRTLTTWVRSEKRGDHNLLKPQVYTRSPR